MPIQPKSAPLRRTYLDIFLNPCSGAILGALLGAALGGQLGALTGSAIGAILGCVLYLKRMEKQMDAMMKDMRLLSTGTDQEKTKAQERIKKRLEH